MDQTSTPKSRAQRTRHDTPIAYWPTSPAPDEVPIPFRLVCPTSAQHPNAGRKVSA